MFFYDEKMADKYFVAISKKSFCRRGIVISPEKGSKNLMKINSNAHGYQKKIVSKKIADLSIVSGFG